MALALTYESEDWQDVLETELLPSSSINFDLLSGSTFSGLLLGNGVASVVWRPYAVLCLVAMLSFLPGRDLLLSRSQG